jgi:hypothetical protein
VADVFDVDAFLDGYKRRVETATISQRADLLAEHARLEADLARKGAGEDVDGFEKTLESLEAVEAQMEGSLQVFSFEACGHEDWYGLLVAHPPSEAETVAMPNSLAGKDFQVHAIAECSKSPKLTVKQVRRMQREWRPDDFDRLWLAVVTANEGAVELPKSGLATAARALYDKRSTNRKARRSPGRRGSAGNAGQSPNTSTTTKAG